MNKNFTSKCKTVCMEKNILCISLPTISTKIFSAYFQSKTEFEFIVGTPLDVLRHCNSNVTIILGGNFNCRTDKGGERGQDLCIFLESYNLQCANDPKQPTSQAHNGYSTIDLVFYSTNLISTPKIRVTPTHISKHHASTAEIELNSKFAESIRNNVRRVNSNVLERHIR